MTARQIATPYRPIRTTVLAAALAVAFGIGLLVGLVAVRAEVPGAQALANAGAAADAAAAKTRAGAPAVDSGAQNLRGAQDVSAATGRSSIAVTHVLEPKPFLTVQDGIVVPGSITAAGAVDIGAHNLRGDQDFLAPAGGTTSTSGTGWSRGAHPL